MQTDCRQRGQCSQKERGRPAADTKVRDPDLEYSTSVNKRSLSPQVAAMEYAMHAPYRSASCRKSEAVHGASLHCERTCCRLSAVLGSSIAARSTYIWHVGYLPNTRWPTCREMRQKVTYHSMSGVRFSSQGLPPCANQHRAGCTTPPQPATGIIAHRTAGQILYLATLLFASLGVFFLCLFADPLALFAASLPCTCCWLASMLRTDASPQQTGRGRRLGRRVSYISLGAEKIDTIFYRPAMPSINSPHLTTPTTAGVGPAWLMDKASPLTHQLLG